MITSSSYDHIITFESKILSAKPKKQITKRRPICENKIAIINIIPTIFDRI